MAAAAARAGFGIRAAVMVRPYPCHDMLYRFGIRAAVMVRWCQDLDQGSDSGRER